MNRFSLLPLLLIAGCVCQTPEFERPPTTGAPWDMTHLIDADPSSVTDAQLSAHAALLSDQYWLYSQVNGVLWPALRTDAGQPNPDRYTRGGDSGLFTGQALSAFCLKYKATGGANSLLEAQASLRGIYLLTHATGTPGVLCRQAFPAGEGAKFGFPDEWESRLEEGFVDTGPSLPDPFSAGTLPPHTFYTRTTKDQLTGIVLGLATVLATLDDPGLPVSHQAVANKMVDVAKNIARAVYDHLKAYDWNIRDARGENDTNADHVDGLLRVALLSVLVHAGDGGLQEDYDDEFESFYALSGLRAVSDRFNNYQQYFAHNLRTSRALSVWMLEGASSDKGQKIAHYIERNIWQHTSGHKNAWFAIARSVTNPADVEARAEGVYSLKSLSLKPLRMWMSPYAGQEQKPNLASVTAGCDRLSVVDPHLRKPEDYSTWQKEPWDVGHLGKNGGWDEKGLAQASGVDFLLAFWLGKAYGIF